MNPVPRKRPPGFVAGEIELNGCRPAKKFILRDYGLTI
jgi:hypothetical protein